MKEICIGDIKLSVKDYHCVRAGEGFSTLPGVRYLSKESPKLWLYVNVTDKCNANCPFCVAAANSSNNSVVSVTEYSKTLERILPFVGGVSFTGGEPLLYPELLNQLIDVTYQITDGHVELDMVTNGTNLKNLQKMKYLDYLTTVHISRHAVSDLENSKLMGSHSITSADIATFIKSLSDPGKVVFNCVLQKGGVDSFYKVSEYLDFSIKLGVENTSFISMFKANAFCNDNYVSSSEFPVIFDDDLNQWNDGHPNKLFDVWNRYSDYNFCHCLSGCYSNEFGSTRYYFRCPGTEESPSYCRQLVYTSNNVLQDGFGTGRKLLI